MKLNRPTAYSARHVRYREPHGFGSLFAISSKFGVSHGFWAARACFAAAYVKFNKNSTASFTTIRLFVRHLIRICVLKYIIIVLFINFQYLYDIL